MDLRPKGRRMRARSQASLNLLVATETQCRIELIETHWRLQKARRPFTGETCMTRNRLGRPRARATLASIGVSMIFATAAAAQPVSVTPATMPSIGTVDERYQSYNVEMLEVTGGRF